MADMCEFLLSIGFVMIVVGAVVVILALLFGWMCLCKRRIEAGLGFVGLYLLSMGIICYSVGVICTLLR